MFLVTGGAGFIGSGIVDALLSDGYTVRILDNLNTGSLVNLRKAQAEYRDRVQFIYGDITNKADCMRACMGIDYVLHQAAIASVPRSLKNPSLYNEVNIQGTVNMLEACVKNGVKRFVFASSSSVYGEAKRYPVNEDDRPAPISPYALSKLAGEEYCSIYSRHFGLETVCLRYFNVFGPRQSAQDEYSAVIPKFIKAIKGDKRPLIYGDGTQSRNFTYIDNVVKANIRAALKEGITHEVFNVHGGEEVTVNDIVEKINARLEKEVKPVLMDKRQGDIYRSCGSIDKICKALNFTPDVDFVTGISMTVAHAG